MTHKTSDRILAALYSYFSTSHDGTTGLVPFPNLAYDAHTTVGAAKMAVYRLVNKGAIEKLSSKEGNGGGVVYGKGPSWEFITRQRFGRPRRGRKSVLVTHSVTKSVTVEGVHSLYRSKKIKIQLTKLDLTKPLVPVYNSDSGSQHRSFFECEKKSEGVVKQEIGKIYDFIGPEYGNDVQLPTEWDEIPIHRVEGLHRGWLQRLFMERSISGNTPTKVTTDIERYEVARSCKELFDAAFKPVTNHGLWFYLKIGTGKQFPLRAKGFISTAEKQEKAVKAAQEMEEYLRNRRDRHEKEAQQAEINQLVQAAWEAWKPKNVQPIESWTSELPEIITRNVNVLDRTLRARFRAEVWELCERRTGVG
jgi:hypothetical protein